LKGDRYGNITHPNHDIIIKDLTIDVNNHLLPSGEETGFAAIALIWGYRIHIENVHAMNGDGGLIGVWSISEGSGGQEDTASRIINNIVENSGNYSTHDTGIALSANNTAYNVVAFNHAINIDGNGIELEDFAHDSIVIGNTVKNNTRYGIYLSNCDYVSLVANVANNNSFSGFHVADSSHVTLTSNIANDNAFRGIDISNSDSCVAVGNDVSGNTGGGFGGVDGCTNTKLAFNVGYVTENSGSTAAIPSGTTVSHGLAGTPTSVVITPTTDAGDFWVSAVAATTFTIAYDGAGNITFYWHAEYEP